MQINGFNNTYQINSNKTKKSFKSNNEVRIQDLYANDMHGMLKGFRKFKTVRDEFVSNQNPDIIKNVILSGDSCVGANELKNKTIVAIQNTIQPDIVAPGNHEFDQRGSVGYSKNLDYARYTTTALNLVTKQGSVLDDDIEAGRLVKSKIIEKNGTKIGYIGLVPVDLFNRLNSQSKEASKDVEVLDMQKTINAVQNEINNMEKQGVNIVTAVSHLGTDATMQLVKNVEGLDVIHDGHSHDLIKGIVPGKNYFISKRGEPILVTQAGKNGHYYGISDIVFDKAKGTIKQASNNVFKLDDKPESLVVKTLENIMMGSPVEIAELAHEVKSQPETELKESPMCSFLCDAYKKLTGADIVLNNTGTMRNTMPKGKITDRMIVDMMPYYNDIATYKLSEKDIITAINGGLEASETKHRTGALQVAGMEYTIGKNNRVVKASLVKDDGTKEPLNVDNPDPNKTFTVAYNTFLSGGTEGLDVLKAPDKMIKKFDTTETDLLIDYLKTFNGPVSIEPQGRITKEN